MADGLLNKASIILTPTGYKAGTLYNVAPVVEPYEDFDFARASVASRVNSSGLVEMVGRTLGTNLIDPLDFTNWINSGSTDITSNSFTTSGSGRGVYYQLTTNNLYKINVTGVSGDISLRYRDGGGAGTILGDFDTDLYFDTTGFSSPNIYLRANSATTATVLSVNIQEIIDTNNIPRISYDSNGDNGHILLEPTSTNLIPYSEDFSQSIYIKDSTVSVGTINNVSPSGESNATKIDVTASGRIYANFTTDTYVSSIFIKAGTFAYFKLAGVQVDLVAVTNANGTIESLGNGWFRVSINYTGNRPFQIQAYPDGSYATHTTSGNYFIWGAQLETLSHPTSYIPTLTGSTETRATETATGAGSADLINSTEGVLYAEIAALVDDSGVREIALSDGSANNRIELRYGSASDRIQLVVRSGGVVQASISNSDYDILLSNKVAIKYKANDFALWINGVEVGTDTSGGVPSGLNELAFDDGNGGFQFYGKCKALAVFNEALSDSELNNLTG